MRRAYSLKDLNRQALRDPRMACEKINHEFEVAAIVSRPRDHNFPWAGTNQHHAAFRIGEALTSRSAEGWGPEWRSSSCAHVFPFNCVLGDGLQKGRDLIVQHKTRPS
jgi:hypothetical protein